MRADMKLVLTLFVTAWLLVAVSEAHFAYAQADRLADVIRLLRDEQIRDGVRIDNLAQRIAIVESLDLQRRLVRLETLSETTHNLLVAVATAVVVQLLITIAPSLAAVIRSRNKGGELP